MNNSDRTFQPLLVMDTKPDMKRCKGGSPMAPGSNQKRKKVKRTKNQLFTASTSKSSIERNPQGMAPDKILKSGAESVRISLLVRALKTVISEPISALRKTADQVYRVKEISIARPSSKDTVPVLDISTGVEEKKRTLLIEDKEVSFRFPTEVNLDGIDIDKLEAPRGRNPRATENNRLRRFSFSERLQDWRIERKLRFNGRRDMFYHHKISGESFRSMVEVMDFIMYEVCPRTKDQKSLKKRSSNDSGLNETVNNLQKRKHPCINPIVVEESSPARSLSLEEIDQMIDSTQKRSLSLEEIDQMIDSMQKMETRPTKDKDDLIDHIPVCASFSDLYELLSPNQTKG